MMRVRLARETTAAVRPRKMRAHLVEGSGKGEGSGSGLGLGVGIGLWVGLGLLRGSVGEDEGVRLGAAGEQSHAAAVLQLDLGRVVRVRVRVRARVGLELGLALGLAVLQLDRECEEGGDYCDYCYCYHYYYYVPRVRGRRRSW